MEEKGKPLVNSCSFAGIRPIMVDLPYPPIQVRERIMLTPIFLVLIIAGQSLRCLPLRSILITKTVYPVKSAQWQKQFWGLQWQK